MNKIEYIIIHHSASLNNGISQLDGVNNFHRQQFNMLSELGYFVGYHEFIDVDGTVTITRKETEEGAHAKNFNLKSYGICMAGDFDKHHPTPKQIHVLRERIKLIANKYNISVDNIRPHRYFTGNGSLCKYQTHPSVKGCAHKSCFGDNLSDTWLQTLVTGVAPAPVVNIPPQGQKVVIVECKIGDTGDNITRLQNKLVEYKCMDKSFITGEYDTRTKDAVFCLQNKFEIGTKVERFLLQGTAVGKKTLEILNQ